MTDPATPDRPRRLRLIISLAAAGLVLLAFIGVGVYGLLTGPAGRPAPDPGGTSRPGTMTPTPGGAASPSTPTLAPLPATKDPEVFARALAQALFTWDTFTTLTPQDHRAVILEAADPSGEETPGLIGDLDKYLPSASTWRSLQEYRTAQTLTIDRLWVPDQWDQAVEAADGQIADGLIAFTVEGTRHRTGVWFDQPVTSEHPVTFTMFLSCPPATEQCVLLRLSQLDNPLR
ncbi:MAG: hypothetical protein IT189_10675 [Microbacteriaceae bacterium]|jgi:hypothetical protein|nr:hypothetical protein [Microbacteriaceae bacterium]